MTPSIARVKTVKLSVNVTNLTDKKDLSSAGVASGSGRLPGLPDPPRTAFVTPQADV